MSWNARNVLFNNPVTRGRLIPSIVNCSPSRSNRMNTMTAGDIRSIIRCLFVRNTLEARSNDKNIPNSAPNMEKPPVDSLNALRKDATKRKLISLTQ